MRIVHELSRTICLVFSKRKLGEVAVYSPVCSCCCRNKHPTADYCGNMLESKGIGAGSSPIGCESVLKASKVQCSSLLLWSDTHMYMYIYTPMHGRVPPLSLFFCFIPNNKNQRNID